MKLADIVNQKIDKPLPLSLNYLKQDQELCREIQTHLQVLGLLPRNGVDGLYGPQTKEAFEQFKQRTHEKELDTLGAGSAKLLLELKELPGGGNLISKTQAEYIYGNDSISDEQLADLNKCLNRFEINTHPRMRHFLSQSAEESGGLKWMKELDSGDRYQGRKDLGNTHPGDGRTYKGAGVLQLTGRNNYQALANYLPDPKVMEGVEYVSTKYPFTSGGFFWYRRSMNALCDHGATVKEVTKRVNGGYRGLAQREAYTNFI